MEDEELVKMFNPTLKMRGNILFFLIVVINWLIWIDSNIGLDICTKLVGLLYLVRNKLEKVRRSTLATKFSQLRAWISLKRASVAPQFK